MPATTHPAATCVAPQRLNRWLQLHLCWLPHRALLERAWQHVPGAASTRQCAKVLVAAAAVAAASTKPADELVRRQLHGVTSKGGCHLRFWCYLAPVAWSLLHVMHWLCLYIMMISVALAVFTLPQLTNLHSSCANVAALPQPALVPQYDAFMRSGYGGWFAQLVDLHLPFILQGRPAVLHTWQMCKLTRYFACTRFHLYFPYSTSNSTNLLCAEKNRTAVHVQYEDWSNQKHQDCLCRKKQECCCDAPDQDASTKAKEASRYPRCTGRVQPGIIHSCDNHSAPRVQC
jgi:hypothetical protein